MATRRQTPEETKEKILSAAKAEFAENGLGGARVDAIAARADTNKRMLYHYFGNKEALYTAVLEQAYADIRSHEMELDLRHLDPEDAIRELVAFTFRYFVENPEFIRLLNDENLYGGEHLQASPRIRAMHSPLIKEIATVLKRGQDSGAFHADADPMQLYISIAGLGYFYFSNIDTLSAIFGRKLGSPQAITKRLDHAIDVIMRYLTHPGK